MGKGITQEKKTHAPAPALEMWETTRPLPYARNPREIPDSAVSKVSGSIREFGFQNPIIVDGDGVILAGHTRLLAAQRLGLEHVPVLVADGLTPAQAKAYRLADNRTGQEASWDTELLGLEMEDLEGLDFDLSLTGFDEDELAGLGEGPAPVVEDEVPEPPEEPVSKPGDLWILGEHRVLCGDATSATDLERLLDGDLCEMVWTDPPWNVAYGESDHPTWKQRTIENDNLGDAFPAFTADFCGLIATAAKPGAPIYMAMSAQEWPVIHAALSLAGFHWSSTIIWVKDHAVLSRKDYHTRYEPLWYGWREGAARLAPLKDRKQNDVWEIDRPSSRTHR